ncbi:unnamed protein product, partial [Amoebophrya sp. A25]
VIGGSASPRAAPAPSGSSAFAGLSISASPRTAPPPLPGSAKAPSTSARGNADDAAQPGGKKKKKSVKFGGESFRPLTDSDTLMQQASPRARAAQSSPVVPILSTTGSGPSKEAKGKGKKK